MYNYKSSYFVRNTTSTLRSPPCFTITRMLHTSVLLITDLCLDSSNTSTVLLTLHPLLRASVRQSLSPSVLRQNDFQWATECRHYLRHSARRLGGSVAPWSVREAVVLNPPLLPPVSTPSCTPATSRDLLRPRCVQISIGNRRRLALTGT